MKGRPTVKIKLSQRKVVVGLSLFSIFSFFGLYFYLNLGNVKEVKAAGNETLATGSFIINMGVTPQTYNNGLKPYGMLYDLLKNYKVPIKWVINSSKAKDGTDFTYGGTNYCGGPFIVPAEYINSTISARITYWLSQGVVGVYTTNAITVPVYATLMIFPTVTIDNLSNKQGIIAQYYTNAGIPSAAYVYGNPSILNECVDIWTNPHGDPAWGTHNYLEPFVKTSKSWIFAECHSVSMMEGSFNPLGTAGLNFLTTNGLQCYGAGKCGTISETHAGNPTGATVTYSNPSHPIMQFMGDMFPATDGGSEKWYIPLTTGAWNSNTINFASTGDGSGSRKGSVLVFGPAYNDPTNGYVMYGGGHDLDGSGSTVNKVAAQRAYFNFVLLGGYSKVFNVSMSGPPSKMKPKDSFPVHASATAISSSLTYEWTSTAGGTFTNPNTKNTVYNAPNFTTSIQEEIRVKVTDPCGRSNFSVQIVPGDVTLPITLEAFTAKRDGRNAELKWVTTSEINNSYFTIERSPDGKTFEEVEKIPGAGNSTIRLDYSWVDENAGLNECYYRLTQTDYDGKFETFNTVFVPAVKNVEAVQVLAPRPSAFTNSFNFEIQSDKQKEATLVIASLNGKIVDKVVFNLDKGNNLLYYNDDKGLPVGIYLAVFSDGQGLSLSTKVMKQ